MRILIEKYDVNPNIRSRGGYAAQHLAGLCKRKEVFDYLASRADCNIEMRDYSGKKAKDYLESKTVIGDESRVMPGQSDTKNNNNCLLYTSPSPRD